MKKHIFVMGLDALHLRQVKQIRHAEDYTFHGLLDYDEVITPESYSFDGLLEKARRQLHDFGKPIEGIISHWDFPASTMLPILAKEFGLRSASLESVLKCEHKYWSRVEQKACIPEETPQFCAVDPFAEDPYSQVTLDFPFWIKPVKSFSSHLGFRIDDREDFDRAMEELRDNIQRIGDAFNVALSYAELPDEIRRIDGNWCVAEEILEGKQIAIEGYIFNGRFAIHGTIDTVKDRNNWSFTRYEYPSAWPVRLQEKMRQSAERVLKHMGYDNQSFGVEFFWNPETDEVTLLEINTRISQSHSPQFVLVEGVSNHQVPVDIAAGREPDFCKNEGRFKHAAKFLLRRYHDAEVIRIPTDDEIYELESEYPGTNILITINEGMRLSDLRDQDSYSFEIANIYLGADTQDEMLEKYETIAGKLHFEFSDGPELEDFQFETVRY